MITLLNDEEWSGWSNNQIAEQCGVSHTFVNNMRGSLETVSSQKRKGLSIVDKGLEPKNTRDEIAKDLGWLTNIDKR